MLRKMYLVPAEQNHRQAHPSARTPGKTERRRRRRNPHDEWVKMRYRLRETGIRDMSRTKAVSGFLRRIMPEALPPPPETSGQTTPAPPLSSPQPQTLVNPKVEVDTPRRRKRRSDSPPTTDEDGRPSTSLTPYLSFSTRDTVYAKKVTYT
jgi:hypothetical protein